MKLYPFHNSGKQKHPTLCSFGRTEGECLDLMIPSSSEKHIPLYSYNLLLSACLWQCLLSMSSAGLGKEKGWCAGTTQGAF